MTRKKNNEKKQKNKKMSLHFGSPNHELSFKLFFLVQTNWFSFQKDAM
jgi:hypothetical protein